MVNRVDKVVLIDMGLARHLEHKQDKYRPHFSSQFRF